MSYPGTPSHGLNYTSSEHPCPLRRRSSENSPLFSPRTVDSSRIGFNPGSVGFNIGSSTNISEPYVGIGRASSSSGTSRNPAYPQSLLSHIAPYPNNQCQDNSHLSSPNAPSSLYNQLFSYSSNQGQTYPQPSSSSRNPKQISNQGQTSQAKSSYTNKRTQSFPSINQGPCHLQSPRPRHHSSISPNSSRNHDHDGGYSNPAPAIKNPATVVPINPFVPKEDAAILRHATIGLGSHEKGIISVLTRRSNAQRLKIASEFKTLYGKDLIKELKSVLSGNFEKLIVALLTPLPQYYAKQLHEAVYGLGTEENVLIEILCVLTNAEIRTVREVYHKNYHKNLESDLKGDTSGHFRRLMVSLCTAGRDESSITDPATAVEDARALYYAGEKRWGTDESTFNMILCQRSHAQLRLVFQEYHRITGHDIEKAIKSEFSGDIAKGLLAIIRFVKNPPAFFARALYKSLNGSATNDWDLIRLVVTRCEIDLGDIKREYKGSLTNAIMGETSGDYRKCLLALIGET